MAMWMKRIIESLFPGDQLKTLLEMVGLFMLIAMQRYERRCGNVTEEVPSFLQSRDFKRCSVRERKT